jgi:hypothetical protein
VAVCSLWGYEFRAQHAIGSRAVVDDEGLLECLRERIGHQPHSYVARAARAAVDNDSDGTFGPFVLGLRTGTHQQHKPQQQSVQLPFHERLRKSFSQAADPSA